MGNQTNNSLFNCILYYRADIYNYEELVLSPLKENTIFNAIEPHLYKINYSLAKEILYGNYEVMKKYSNIINYLEEIIKDYKCHDVESFIKYYIVDMNNMNLHKISYNYIIHSSRHQYLAEYDNFL